MQVQVARIGKPHGIRGEVTVQLFTDAPEERFAPGATLDIEDFDANSLVGAIAPAGVLTVAGSRWNKKILVVGFDATDDAVAAVKAGKMAATVAQKPNLMGETAVETAIQILQGETVEKTIPVEVELITKESVK